MRHGLGVYQTDITDENAHARTWDKNPKRSIDGICKALEFVHQLTIIIINMLFHLFMRLQICDFFNTFLCCLVCSVHLFVVSLSAQIQKGIVYSMRSACTLYIVYENENEEKSLMRFNGNLLHCVLCWWSELTIKLNVINFNLSFVCCVCVLRVYAWNACCPKDSQWNWTHFAGFQLDFIGNIFQNLLVEWNSINRIKYASYKWNLVQIIFQLRNSSPKLSVQRWNYGCCPTIILIIWRDLLKSLFFFFIEIPSNLNASSRILISFIHVSSHDN